MGIGIDIDHGVSRSPRPRECPSEERTSDTTPHECGADPETFNPRTTRVEREFDKADGLVADHPDADQAGVDR
jgi:hypothetical protein